MEEIVDRKIRVWRDEDLLSQQLSRLNEIRQAAVDYVSPFLNGQATPSAIEQLKTQFGTGDQKTLDAELRGRIREWIATVEDSELLKYDVVSVKDLVFAQLRSWC